MQMYRRSVNGISALMMVGLVLPRGHLFAEEAADTEAVKRRLFWLAPSDWSMLVTGIAIAAMFILFV
jgi:hypothetical protein